MNITDLKAPSEIEIKNARTVLEMLSNMEDISYKSLRDDIFQVENIEMGVSCVIDVEETIVCISSDVCDVPTNRAKQIALFELLMELNNVAIHGKFAINDNKIVCKDNLEFANLDMNELEASIGWVLSIVARSIEKISEIMSAE